MELLYMYLKIQYQAKNHNLLHNSYANLECFETNALVSLQDSNEIISVSEHFYVQSGRPQLTLLITHRSKVSRHQAMLNTQPVSPEQSRKARREHLTEDEKSRYEAVRAFRNQRAIDLGRPPYALMTNAQLKEAAKVLTGGGSCGATVHH